MRFLKNKIARANAFLASRANLSETSPKSSDESLSCSPKNVNHSRFDEETDSPFSSLKGTYENTRQTKNISKNFGKAISNFALSDTAVPYLQCILKKYNASLAEFKDYINNTKDGIDGLIKFRNSLIPMEEDTEKVATFKRVFRELGEIFVKYFSVNWIIHGRIRYKDAHMKYRFRMLRRIQNPELFTYIRRRNE